MTKAQENAFRDGQVAGIRFAGKAVLDKAIDYFSQPSGGRLEVQEVATLLKDLAHKLSRIADTTERHESSKR